MKKTDQHTLSEPPILQEGSKIYNENQTAGVSIRSEEEPDEISLKELILKIKKWCKYLWSKKLIILIAVIFGSTLGLLYSTSKKPLYRAELSFALEDDKGGTGLGGALGLASQFGFDLGGGGGGAFTGDNLLELMKSRSMVEKALLTAIDINGKKQTLAELYISFNNLRENWNNVPDLKNIYFLPNADRSKFSFKQDSILGIFHRTLITDALTVDKLDKKLSIIILRVKSENELFSKYFAEVLVKEVSDFYVDTKTKKSVQNLALLQHQTDSVRYALNSAISGVAISNDATPSPNPSRQALRVPSLRRQVDVQANTAILQSLVQNLEIAKVSLRKETPLVQIIDNPILPLEKEFFGRKKGIMLGGILAGFLIIFYLIIKKVFTDMFS